MLGTSNLTVGNVMLGTSNLISGNVKLGTLNLISGNVNSGTTTEIVVGKLGNGVKLTRLGKLVLGNPVIVLGIFISGIKIVLGIEKLGITKLTIGGISGNGVKLTRLGKLGNGVKLTRLGKLMLGVMLIIDGMLIGPIGPISKQGNTIGGICGVNDGIGIFGKFTGGILGKVGIGISRPVVVVGGVGSVTTSLFIGV